MSAIDPGRPLCTVIVTVDVPSSVLPFLERHARDGLRRCRDFWGLLGGTPPEPRRNTADPVSSVAQRRRALGLHKRLALGGPRKATSKEILTRVMTPPVIAAEDQMADDRIIHNGVEVVPEWPARIEAAQQETAHEIGRVWYLRIRYGDEHRRSPAGPCHDCAVLRGQYHVPGCDAEECPRCHGQAIGCDCAEPVHLVPQAGPES